MQYILIFTLLLNLLDAKSTDYSIIIKKPFNEVLLDITQDYNRNISAVGYSNSYKISQNQYQESYSDAFEYLSSLSNSHGSHMHLVKANHKANIILNKTISTTQFSKAVALVKTPTNGYFVGGYTLDGSLMILKLDSNGNQIFSKIFGTKNQDRMNNLISLRDGGVLSIGYSTTSRSPKDNIFESGLGLNDIYLTRFSKGGLKLWSKKYGTQNDDKGIDAVEAQDGTIIVVSSMEELAKKDLSLMRITENGDRIWLKHYESEDNITPHKIIKLRDNNFLLSLSKKDNLQNDQIRVVKFDIQKNILIDKEIYTNYSSILNDIKEYSNGNIIGVGHVEDAYNTDALVMLLSRDLKLLTQNHYGDENYDTFNAVTILNNSQAAAAGIHTDEDVQESNMWIVKFDKDLTLSQLPVEKSAKSIALYDKLKKIFHQEIEQQKLIITKDLKIEVIAKNLYFEVSKYKLTSQQKDFLLRFSNKLLPLLKSYHSTIKTIEINGHTSSEWGDLNFTNRYLKNEKLSMNRSYSTLEFIFKNQNQETKVWLSNVIKGSGLSYSENVLLNSYEDKEKSRRVSFKIILNDTLK
ncbi:MAG: hypothetical protein U9P72_11965 [Campylobacterota bacterium]|nr:hypothetical protein [Campylobacterota bacterium]